MNISSIASKFLSPLSLPDKPQTGNKPGDYIISIFSYVMYNAKPRGQKVSLGPTHPLRGEHAYRLQAEQTELSMNNQFGIDAEKLPDGRHRFYRANGTIVDRKS